MAKEKQEMLQHQSENGNTISEEDKQAEGEKQGKRLKGVPYFQLFRYADKTEKALVILGALCSVGVGAGDPLLFFLFGDVVNDLADPNKLQEIYKLGGWFALLGILIFLIGFAQIFCLHYAAMRQANRIQLLYFKAVLRQDIQWYDQQTSGALVSQLSQSIKSIEKGIGSKFGLFIQYLTTFVVGLIIGFVKGWKLSLVAIATLPLNLIAFGVFAYVMQKYSKMEFSAYAEAGSIAGEVLTAIRTVVAFGGEEKEHTRYVSKLGEAEKVGIKKSTAIGAATGFLGLIIYCSAALIFWYGVQLLVEVNTAYDAGDVVIIFFNIILGAISIGSAMPNFEYFAAAKAAAVEIFQTIERIPPIDKEASGKIIPEIGGRLEFKNVSFTYETRPDNPVLQDFSVTIEPGQTVAFVGPSGSGKSTVVHLLQAFYAASSGEVLVDGTNLLEFELPWYRRQLGVVQQEPVLFAGTVAENIRMGKLDATMEEVEEAARMANAHDFIIHLPNAYDTWIGEGGGGMSGGQKQRIAIARALVRNPKILLLDEATSALDTKSERIVQAALDKACAGRTVVVVAHRLTTVRDADRILVLDKGKIRETGTHDELVALGGIYATLLAAQEATDNKETEEDSEEEVDELRNENIDEEEDTGSTISVVSNKSESNLEAKHHSKWYGIKRMMKYSAPEWGFTLGGCIGAAIAALATPGFLLLYAEIFRVFELILTNKNEAEKQTEFITGMMAVVAVFYLIGMCMEGYFFGVVGERLTRRIRGKLFYSMVHQEIGWFDRPENQPGVLTSRLATEATAVRNVSGFQLAIIIEAVILIVVAFVIGFIDCWEVTLLLLGFMPLILLGGYMEYTAFFDQGSGTEEKSQRAQVAQEAFSANRTVTTLGLEKHFTEKFQVTLEANEKEAIKGAIVFSVLSSLAKAINYLAYACAFPLGAYLITLGRVKAFGLFRGFSAITFSLSSCGRAVAFIPEFKSATEAARNTVRTIDRRSKIPKADGIEPEKEFDGKLEFKNVSFRYPTRSNRILRGFTHKIERSQFHALVGQSGCGKSTLMQLVLRFYDAMEKKDSGIYMNGHNIRDVSPNWVRRQIGLVAQEPNLFNMTIKQNIAYGMNFRDVTMDEIIEAAKSANIHDFIVTQPEGYETNVGERGSQLSGGQKQRVAIARAILRQPKLLLLDEATSALDNESERIVQAALEAVMESRTCLVIAHRLSTVEKADLILVLEDGRIKEKGTAKNLMAKKGAYYALHCMED